MMKLILVCLITFVMSPFAFAAEVTQVKGGKALIDLKGDAAQVGQKFFIVSSAGKRIGIIEIKQVKGGRAIADLIKGRGEVGASLMAQGPAAPPAASSGGGTRSTSRTTTKKKAGMGLLVGLAMNTFSMDIGPTNQATRTPGNLKGTSFSVKGFYDYAMSPSFNLRFASGLETFSASGTISASYCDSTTTCSVSFMYIPLEGSAQYNYTSSGSSRGWIGAGYSFLVQMSSKKNIPNLETSGGTNQMIFFSTGYDIGMSGGSFIPVVLEYGLFPGSSDVKASGIYARVGYGF